MLRQISQVVSGVTWQCSLTSFSDKRTAEVNKTSYMCVILCTVAGEIEICLDLITKIVILSITKNYQARVECRFLTN